jgi:hypothetical protein
METPASRDWDSFQTAVINALDENHVVIVEGYLLYAFKELTCACAHVERVRRKRSYDRVLSDV